ncbi:UNVERIFIED_CONTAM: hypothetical protein GTU68_046165, partial [Idotea baltica]|nr:hypothetical protein [Idotea baltica]
DTAAYFGGSLIGGAKLLPRISPGKTWSGFICGVLAASLSALYIGSTGFELFLGSSNLQAFCFGSLFGLLAVIGDLFESLLKRSFGCKDSGTILPGHGGILDRVDAHLFAFPVLLVLFKLI